MTGEPLTLDADGVATLLGYHSGDGKPNGRRIRELYRSGRLPAPIDPELVAREWRWSRRTIVAYVDGGLGVAS